MCGKEATGVPVYRGALSDVGIPIWADFLFRQMLAHGIYAEMATMDEYIDQLLAEIPDSPLRGVVQNILDEPIPVAVKERLLKPLAPRKYRPSPPAQGEREKKEGR